MWDGASCIPLTFAGNTAILPCMDSYQGVKYSALCEYFILNMVLAGYIPLYENLLVGCTL